MAKKKSTLISLLDAGPGDPLAALFGAWRLWLAGALLGAVIAAAIFSIAPPDYRAQATVVVDNNLEEAWVYFPDRQMFQFLRRETDRLVELAWSDEVIGAVSAQSGSTSSAELRSGSLELSQPSDGGWHFYAAHSDPAQAAKMATIWADAFVFAAREATEASPAMQAARAELDELVLGDPEPNDERLLELTSELTALAELSKGVSPYIELYFSAAADLPTQRASSQASYLLVGSMAGTALLALYSLLSIQKPKEKK